MRSLHWPHSNFRRTAVAIWVLLTFGLNAQALAASTLNEAHHQLEQWVQLESQISREQGDWRVEKNRLQQLLKTLGQSKQTLAEKVDQLRNQTSRADDQRLALIAHKRDLQERHKALRIAVEGISQTLADQHTTLPETLQKQLAEDYQRYVFSEDSELSLVKRVSGLARVVGKIERFDREVSTRSGLLPIAGDEGKTHQVDLLYLGLDHAFFIDRTGRHAGYGWRSSKGWQWRSESTLAAPVRRAVAIAKGERAEAFVSLPFPVNMLTPNQDAPNRDSGGAL